MPFQIVQGDITTMEVDAVVNAANEELQMGSGVCGSIFRAAGKQDLQRECDAIGHCATGQAVMTGGYGLPAGQIIHTVGPVWRGGAQGEAALLAGCYQSSLRLAAAAGLHSVAFPLISSGIYGYPPEEALRIAGASITSFLEEHELDVYLVIFDRRVFSIGEERLRGVQRYIDEHWRDAPAESVPPPIPAAAEPAANAADLVRGAADALRELRSPSPFIGMHRKPLEHSKKTADTTRRLEDLVNQLDESFSQMLLRLIDEKGKSDVQVYKRANIDRKLFSKIRSNPAYNPSKATAIALCVALELSLDEVRDLLGRAGYALSPSNKFDVIVEYFIEQGIYDIFAINEALFAFDQGLLGA